MAIPEGRHKIGGVVSIAFEVQRMGFYIRKSVSVGPLRFNLSGSGIGVSAGIPGFRVGSGPRGNYVRIGHRGVYYQQAIPSSPPSLPPAVSNPALPFGTHAALEDIRSASATQIVDSSSEQLLDEIRTKRRKWTVMPAVIIAAILMLIIASASGWPDWVDTLLLALAIAAVVAARYRDKLVKSVVILYEFEPTVEAAFRQFVESSDAVAASRKAWHVSASGKVFNRKYHAGASELVKRNPTSLRAAEPPFLKTNVPVLSVRLGPQQLFFLPDRLLVYDSSGIGAVTYRTLDIAVKNSRFIEADGVPSDATVVGHTWKYVNKGGGPDRRFSNNPQIPICSYDELHLQTASGLNEVVQISRCGVGSGFADAVRALAQVSA